jgi:O-antigen biosynthesis protein WbqP
MSLIGFRPTIPKEEEVDNFRKQFNVYQVKPGISGWAQVNGRDVLAAEPKMKAMYDNYYVQKVSLWLDIKIFFMTIVAVFKSDGIEEGTIENKEENK